MFLYVSIILFFVLLFHAFHTNFATLLFQCSMPREVFSQISGLRFPTRCVRVSFSAGDGLGGFRLPTSAFFFSDVQKWFFINIDAER